MLEEGIKIHKYRIKRDKDLYDREEYVAKELMDDKEEMAQELVL